MNKKGKKEKPDKQDKRPTKIYPDPVMGPIRGAYVPQPTSRVDSASKAAGTVRTDLNGVAEGQEWSLESQP